MRIGSNCERFCDLQAWAEPQEEDNLQDTRFLVMLGVRAPVQEPCQKKAKKHQDAWTASQVSFLLDHAVAPCRRKPASKGWLSSCRKAWKRRA